ncbi:CheR family methyltransferase [Bermanella marisrubri]|uniref:protein-glutamate O-methyltransferase n=1 Tax=Bermanella marisrubri TaxID=207949 RepID=Q1MZ06_9GAMM|nr:CheR family methyltransferase [Bermanella marisrubri]EAT11222.1 Methylase of chemotaxis methyl-accepting protein [Oceanobacter sp. RED65] [Bermanella marisrubri]
MSSPGWTLQALPQMSDQQFQQWQELLEDRTGIFLAEQRKSLLQSSLMTRMRELECTDYQEYYDQIVHGPMGRIEWAKLIDRLTVQETRFFRDPEAFKYVAQFIQSQRDHIDRKNPLDIWSVGCSSGEEVYSLAMLAHEVLSQTDQQEEFMITGTDISVPVLNKAREGLYSSRRVEVLNQHYLDTYFDEEPKGYSVKPEVKRQTCFAQVNVLEIDQSPQTQRHIIYCQNLLIYFRRWRRQEILNQLVDRLLPGGLLLIGMGEIVEWQHPQLTPVKGESVTAFIKRKI